MARVPAIVGVARVGASRVGYSDNGVYVQVGQRTRTARIGWARIGAARIGASVMQTAWRMAEPSSFSLEESGWAEPPVCRFAFVEDAASRPHTNDFVVVAFGSLRNRLFCGYVNSVSDDRLAPGRYQYAIEAEGLSSALLGVPVFGTYSGRADVIVQQLLAAYAPQVKVLAPYLSAETEIAEILFDGEPLLKACQELARRSGVLFWVDANGYARFAASAAMPAPFDVTETGGLAALNISEKSADLVTRVIVRHSLLTDYWQTYKGDSVTKEFPLFEPVHTVLSLTVNGVAVTYGSRYQEDNSGNDFSIQYDQGYINLSDHATLTSAETLQIHYLAKTPARLTVDDAAAQMRYGIRARTIDDRTIISQADALSAAHAVLDRYAQPDVSAAYAVWQTLGEFANQRLQVGQAQRLNARGVDETLTVQRVSVSAVRPAADWSVVFAVAVTIGKQESQLHEILDTKAKTDIKNETLISVAR